MHFILNIGNSLPNHTKITTRYSIKHKKIPYQKLLHCAFLSVYLFNREINSLHFNQFLFYFTYILIKKKLYDFLLIRVCICVYVFFTLKLCTLLSKYYFFLRLNNLFIWYYAYVVYYFFYIEEEEKKSISANNVHCSMFLFL